MKAEAHVLDFPHVAWMHHKPVRGRKGGSVQLPLSLPPWAWYKQHLRATPRYPFPAPTPLPFPQGPHWILLFDHSYISCNSTVSLKHFFIGSWGMSWWIYKTRIQTVGRVEAPSHREGVCVRERRGRESKRVKLIRTSCVYFALSPSFSLPFLSISERLWCGLVPRTVMKNV